VLVAVDMRVASFLPCLSTVL